MTGGQKELFAETKNQQTQDLKIIRLDKNRPALKIIKANNEETEQHQNYFK